MTDDAAKAVRRCNAGQWERVAAADAACTRFTKQWLLWDCFRTTTFDISGTSTLWSKMFELKVSHHRIRIIQQLLRLYLENNVQPDRIRDYAFICRWVWCCQCHYGRHGKSQVVYRRFENVAATWSYWRCGYSACASIPRGSRCCLAVWMLPVFKSLWIAMFNYHDRRIDNLICLTTRAMMIASEVNIDIVDVMFIIRNGRLYL